MITGDRGGDRCRPRVGIIAPSGRAIGGQAAQASFLLNKWSDDPLLDVTLIESDPPLPALFRRLERVPYLRTVLRFLVLLSRLSRNMKDLDIAHIFAASYWAFLLVPAPALLVARLRGIRTLVHYHSGEAADHLRNWRSGRFFLRRADAIVVPSDYLREVFAENNLQADVVGNGIDDRLFSFRKRSPLQARILCTRAFEPYYRVDNVIRAFAKVKQRFPEARLTLVGSGREEQKLRNLVAESGLSQSVQFAGPVKNEEIAQYYDGSDIYLNASELDNMPVSLLEAFAAGTVVVSTSPGGIPYLVSHNETGLLSPVGSPDALAENVIKVLTDSALAERLSRNAHSVSREYSWSCLRNQWLNVYGRVAGKEFGVADAKSGLCATGRSN